MNSIVTVPAGGSPLCHLGRTRAQVRLVNRPATGLVLATRQDELGEEATMAVPPWRPWRSTAMPSEAVGRCSSGAVRVPAGS